MDYITPTHQEILDVVQQANVMVIIDNHQVCRNDKYDGFVISPKDYRNESGKNEFVICVQTHKKLYPDWQDELGRTIAHEAVHVAQICKRKDGYISPLGFRDDVEKEAFAVQSQPKEVLRIVKKYCL